MFNPSLWFDRGLSSKSYKQLLLLLLSISIVILTAFSIVCAVTDHNEIGLDELFMEVVAVFLDPGSVWNVNDFSQRPNDAIPNFGVVIISVLGLILFVGVFISVLSNIFERRVEKYRNGEIVYNLKDHVVIIGYDDIVPFLISQICNNKVYEHCYILVQSTQNIPNIKKRVLSSLSTKQRDRVIFISASIGSTEDLESLFSYQAREIFIIGDNDNTENNHDSSNIDCLSRLVDIHRTKVKCQKIPFNVLIESQNTYTAFLLTDLSKQWRDYIDFHPFNLYSEWATKILVSKTYECGNIKIKYPDILTRNMSDFTRSESIPTSLDKHVHLVIIGMSQMGTSLAVEAAHLLHLTNAYDDEGDLIKERQTVITFIDDNAWEEMNKFCNRYRHFFEIAPATYHDLRDDKEKDSVIFPKKGNDNYPENELDFLDIRFEFVQGQIESNQVQELIKQWVLDPSQILSIAVCLTNDAQNITGGLYLPDIVYTHNINIFIHQESSCALVNLLGSNEVPNKYNHIYPFGMKENALDIGNDKRLIAQKINYLYDYYNEHNKLPDSIPDNDILQQLWNAKSVSHQWSNLYVAQSLPFKLSCIDSTPGSLSEEDIQKIAKAEHGRWCVERLLIGYSKPTIEDMAIINKGGKDVARHYKNDLFKHPDIIPYKYLTDNSKQYDINIAKGIPLIMQ